MFEWSRFLAQHNIEVWTTGPNTRKGELSIRCPWCGANDPSHHMNINPQRGAYGCLRNREHRGRSPTRLVQALLQCSWQRAQSIVGDDISIASDLMAAVSAMEPAAARLSQKKRKLELPEEFKAIVDLPSARPFINYLEGRGFSRQQVLRLTKRYGLRYATRGPYKGRIVFPVEFEGKLCTWTARTIYKGVDLRYKTLTQDKEKATKEGSHPALGAIGDYLLWFDDLMDLDDRYHTICIVEGPFDALKVDVLGMRHGVCATCFFTSQPSDKQIALMHELLPRFQHRILIPDQNAEAVGLKTSARIRSLDVDIRMMPRGLKDPGELTEDTLLRFLGA
jgi:hypothetical protein